MYGRKKQAGWLLAVLAVLVVTALFLATYFQQSRTITGFERMIAQTAEVPANWVGGAARTVGQFFTWMFNWKTLQRENDLLTAQVARLEAENAMLQEAAAQAEGALTLQGFAQSNADSYTYLFAHVSAKDSEGLLNQFLIDKGSADGITKGMCVVGTRGLIGRVVEVGTTYSKVGTLLDPSMAVSVVAERSRDEGVLKGLQSSGEGEQRCDLLYLPFDADLVPGDTVVTTDLGTVYPRGLPVGTIVEVSLESNANVTALVEPAEDFHHIENVLVILETKESLSTSEELP